MMKKLAPVFFLGLIALFSCEPNNPFNTGPIYDYDGNLAKDRVTIKAYLDTAKIDSVYRIHDPRGVVIIVQEEGVGSRPVTNSVVYTNYTGFLMQDGTVFDTSYEDVARANNIFDEKREYIPLRFILNNNQVIFGWDVAFSRLRPKSKAVIVVPSPLAYRDASRDKIPSNSILVFKVDFLGID
jgi:FKBP-type peptidyl-prolyl cis-trans isomerase FkpA